MPKLTKELSPSGAFLSGGTHGLLLDFLDGEKLAAPACRARLAQWEVSGRVPLAEFMGCLQSIYKQHPRRGLGLAIGAYGRPHHGGVFGYLCLSCDSVGEMLPRFESYYSLMWEGFVVAVTIGDQDICIRWKLSQDFPQEFMQSRLSQLGFETGLAAFLAACRFVAGKAFSPVAVDLVGAAPEQVDVYTRFFGCPVRFGAPAPALTFPLSILSLPIETSSPGLRDLMQRRAEMQIGADAWIKGDAFLKAVHQVLLRAMQDRKPTIVYVANGMAISRATLQRRLEERAVNFRDLLDKTRMSLAKMYMEDRSLSLAEVAWLLVFSDQSAFSRSFKRWTGQGPQEFRKRLHNPGTV